jgi:hypothetical protein
MITPERANRLLDEGLSLMPVGSDKKPLIAWKKLQSEQIQKEELSKHYNSSSYIGIITGYQNLECIDIDLKVLSSLEEQRAFWKEYYSFLCDNIDDFEKKFTIYKTKNQGYHILYKCNTIDGNKKIAKLKGHTEAIIESRGRGGYVFVYDDHINENTYLDIQEISEEDRACLWEISSTYNYIDHPVSQDKESEKEYTETRIKPWEDYNAKTSIFDIVGSDFDIVRTISDRYIIKRHGASSPHSGYIYKDSKCMYLFSTGSLYPHETLITPFAAYCFKNHNGDFKAASADIYKQGFGSRMPKKEIAIEPVDIKTIENLEFPLDVFPESLQRYIIECNKTLDSSIDYMGCSLLWLTSVIIGNTMQVEVKRGWRETANIWLAVVGKAGIGKTPSINNIIFPLQNVNSREVKRFIKEREKYDHYNSLDKKEKQNYEEIQKPIKTQFIANDITLEALVALHSESKNSVGVFKDELNGWFKDMNKYRAGSDLEFWLSTWSGKSVSFDRKTSKSSFIDKPCIPVLGGIQPSILNTFYTEENKDNGFVDRMLLSFPDLQVDTYNPKELDFELLQWYNDSIIYLYDDIKNRVTSYDNDGEITPIIAHFDIDTEAEWQSIFNDITAMQNSEEENEYMKSMLPKQKSYIPRFSLLIHLLDHFFGGQKSDIQLISHKSMVSARRLSEYFTGMAKKIKVNSLEVNNLKEVARQNKEKSKKDQFLEMVKLVDQPNLTEIAELLNVSRMTLHRWKKD